MIMMYMWVTSHLSIAFSQYYVIKAFLYHNIIMEPMVIHI